ncbi:MAG: GNAT family N-acetyltransferase [Chloroflexales bacterium]|nr:GNAT family N-acetyltransferase [Chloroflexales bacterium]
MTVSGQRPGITLDAMRDGEVDLLTILMARTFDADAPAGPDFDRHLLDCYHSSDFFVRFPPACLDVEQYTLHIAGEVGGAVVIWHFACCEAVLGLYFIVPDFQRLGVGRAGWGLVEARYPEVRHWAVAAPRWSPRTLRFYERQCGFHPECTTGAYVTLVKDGR